MKTSIFKKYKNLINKYKIQKKYLLIDLLINVCILS